MLQGVVATGADVLPARCLQDIFAGQTGSIVNFGLFGQSLRNLNQWYQDHGIFGQVDDSLSQLSQCSYSQQPDPMWLGTGMCYLLRCLSHDTINEAADTGPLAVAAVAVDI